MTNKTQPSNDKSDVEKFIQNIDNEQKRQDSYDLLKIISEATGAEPVMWGSSIVGFGSYHYKYASGREGDFMAVGFSPRKEALVLYGILFYENNRKEVEELGPYRMGKGCIYIKKLSDVDQVVLTKLIKKAFKEKDQKVITT